MKKIGIIVLNWNGKEDTKKCISSLLLLSYPHVEIIIVDNGSTDGSVAIFREQFPTCTLIETGENLGYAGGNNAGIEYGITKGFDFFLLLNNDTTVDPLILEAFLDAFTKEPKVGILGAKIYLMNDRTRLDHFGGNWNHSRREFDYVGYKDEDLGQWEHSQHLDYVCGAAIMIKREVVETIGVLDSRFFLYWEEADFCFRAKQNGFEIKTCPQAKIWHKVSASFTGGKPHASYFVWRNRLLWIERNFRGFRRTYYLSRLLSLELFSLYAKRNVRVFQFFLQKFGKRKNSRNHERIKRYDAAICGMHDYVMRRFGPGRSKNFMNCQ